MYIQGDQKVYVHPMITTQKVTSNDQVSPASLQGDTSLTLTPSVIPNSNYVIMVIEMFKIFLRVFCTVVIRCTEIF
jgi:hypothetical protein